jgi:hypothetical protein
MKLFKKINMKKKLLTLWRKTIETNIYDKFGFLVKFGGG